MCFVTVFFVGRVPLYGVLSFPPLAYSVPDLVNSKLGWTALDVQCTAFMNFHKTGFSSARTVLGSDLYTHVHAPALHRL